MLLTKFFTSSVLFFNTWKFSSLSSTCWSSLGNFSCLFIALFVASGNLHGWPVDKTTQSLNDSLFAAPTPTAVCGSNIILDPHTAVGVGAVNKLSFNDCVVLSTAHPCKFPDATNNAINKHEKLPHELQYVLDKEENFQVIKNDIEEVKNFVKSKA